MSWIVDNWYLVLGLLALAGMGVSAVYGFINMKKDAQIEKVKEWLRYAVTECEKALGSGTGQLKLRMCYDLFVQRFQWVAKVITFTQFSRMVDEALEWLEVQLQTNNNVKEIVNEGK